MRNTKFEFDGMISNTHFGDDTVKEDIIRGYEMLKQVAKLPIRAIGVDEKLSADFDSTFDNTPVWIYKRMMPKAFW